MPGNTGFVGRFGHGKTFNCWNSCVKSWSKLSSFLFVCIRTAHRLERCLRVVDATKCSNERSRNHLQMFGDWLSRNHVCSIHGIGYVLQEIQIVHLLFQCMKIPRETHPISIDLGLHVYDLFYQFAKLCHCYKSLSFEAWTRHIDVRILQTIFY